MNKYEIIKSFKTLSTIPQDFKALIPNIIENDKEGKVFETIYCLFIIILYEFNFNEFEDIEDYKQKMIKYTDVMFETRRGNSSNFTKGQAANEVNQQILINDVETSTFSKIINSSIQPGGNSYGFSKFLYIFSNSNPSTISFIFDRELFKYTQHFTDDSTTTNFCKFLIKYNVEISNECLDSHYIIWNLFSMVKYLL